MPDTTDIAANLTAIRNRIAAAARAGGRDPADVTLVAVSKTHPASAVAAALGCGQDVFGENRVQEAAAKFQALRDDHPQLRLHLIGGLQTNKAREAVRLAHTIESLDRPRLALALADAIQREGRSPALLVQVNVGDEAQKSGVARAEADDLIVACMTRFGPALRGVMAVPPEGADPTAHFRWLAECARRHGLPVISMGMSGDFELAIRLGATHVRLGSAIFGQRPPQAMRA